MGYIDYPFSKDWLAESSKILGGEDFQFSMGLDMVQLAKRLARARSITL